MADERHKPDADRKAGGVVGGYASTDAIGAISPTIIVLRINSTTGRLLVDSNATGGTEYTEGDADASITGRAIMWEDVSDTLRVVSASKPLPIDVTTIVPGTGASNLGKAEDAVHASGDVGVMMLGVRQDDAAALADDGDYTPFTTGDHGCLNVDPQHYIEIANTDATTGWTALNADVTGLATDLDHVIGTASVEFDKTDGGADSTVAGIQKTITSINANKYIHEGGGFIMASINVSSVADIAYAFIRLGTDSSNYNEWRVDDDDLLVGWNNLRFAMTAPNTSGSVGNGWNSAAVTYVAIGVVLDAQNDALADIRVDNLRLNSGMQTSADITSQVSTSVSSPNIRLIGYGGSVDTGQGNLSAAGTLRVTVADDDTNLAGLVTRTGEVQASPTANTILARLKTIGDGQLADGHAVTIDNISSNEVFVRGSQSAGSAVDGEVMTIQGIASMTPVATTESSPISGFATSAKQLADGHNVTVDNIIGSPVFTQHNISALAHGVKTVTTAGTDVVLASSTACKRVTIQAQTDNTGLIAVGATGVDATEATGTGIILYPGDTYELETDNLADIYIDSTVNGEGVRYSYFT